MFEGFEWKGVECSLVEMAREEVGGSSPMSCVELTPIPQGQSDFVEAILESDCQDVTDTASLAS